MKRVSKSSQITAIREEINQAESEGDIRYAAALRTALKQHGTASSLREDSQHQYWPQSDRKQNAMPSLLDAVVGERIREARLAAAMSTRLLAAAVGIDEGRLEKYEAGDKRIDASTLYEISCLLSRRISFFFGTEPSLEANTRFAH